MSSPLTRPLRVPQVEQLTAENRSWRPVQRQLETKIEQLMAEMQKMEEELERWGAQSWNLHTCLYPRRLRRFMRL